MLEFIRSVYRVFVLIGFWVFLIGCTICGGVLANMTYSSSRYSSSGVHPILGGFLGLIIGFIFDVIIFGFLATILNIDENTEYLRYNSSKIGTQSGNILIEENSSGINTNNAPPVNRNYGDTWVCKKCGEKNPLISSSCKGCGEYK